MNTLLMRKIAACDWRFSLAQIIQTKATYVWSKPFHKGASVKDVPMRGGSPQWGQMVGGSKLMRMSPLNINNIKL